MKKVKRNSQEESKRSLMTMLSSRHKGQEYKLETEKARGFQGHMQEEKKKRELINYLIGLNISCFERYFGGVGGVLKDVEIK